MKKKAVIIWIYFLLIISLSVVLNSIMVRSLRFTPLYDEYWNIMIRTLMNNFIGPLKDYFIALTILYMVYHKCRD